MSDNDYFRLEVFGNESDALHAKAVLEESGIEVRLSGLEPSALGISLDGPDSIELYVHKDDFDKSGALLKELEAEDEDEPVPAWTCKCGEDVDEGFGICWSCGNEYQKPE